MNISYDDVEQQWKAVQPEGYYQYQSFCREVCYNKLAERMKEAGYEIEEARKIGFYIKGFPAVLRDQFSKRHEEIERIAARMEDTSQDGLQKIAGSTRAEKVIIEPEELRRQWREASGDHLNVVKEVIADADGTAKAHALRSASEALDRAQAEVFERHSTIDERILLREALISGRADVELEELRKEIELRVKRGDSHLTG